MKAQQRHQLKADVAQKILQVQNVTLGIALTSSRLSEDEEDRPSPEQEPPEPPALEDLGDSDRFFDDSPTGNVFDRAWKGPLRLISQLPRSVRPPLEFRIDSNLDLHALGMTKISEAHTLKRALAEAIVEHLRHAQVELRVLGDWCAVPCIGGNRELADLVPEHLRTALSETRLRSLGHIVKDFAIELPSGDVVTPQTLLDRARKGKHTTRAAALRLASQRPEVMPDGERWTVEDWAGFETTQRKKRKPYPRVAQSKKSHGAPRTP